MSDDYMAALIVEELWELCPGPKGCHGCQNWCPKCGDVGHVCDDPECDTHRRDTDVEADLRVLEKGLATCAKRCSDLEQRRLQPDVLAASAFKPAISTVKGGTMEVWGLSNAELGWKVREYEDLEKEARDLEEELREIQKSGADLVPRRKGGETVPRDR